VPKDFKVCGLKHHGDRKGVVDADPKRKLQGLDDR
jgi:hypothetical protein